MQDTVQQRDIEQRLATLESRFEQLVGPLRPSSVSVGATPVRTEPPAHWGDGSPRPGERCRPAPLSGSSASYPSGRAAPVPLFASFETTSASLVARSQSLSDLVGGRLLAWLGGVTTVIGIVLFLALAISRGWIGQEARVMIAAAVSCALMGAGAWH